MYISIIVVHIVACVFLIASILLQAGRGGGLAEAFGGKESAESLLGTQAPTVLKRATTISAILFLSTSLLLGIVTARRGRSLLGRGQMPVTIPLREEQKTPEGQQLPAELPSESESEKPSE